MSLHRSPINYSNAQLEDASDQSYYIYQTLPDCVESLSEHDESNLKDFVPKDTIDCIHKFRCDLEHSMSDDLHTPVVLVALSEPLKTMNDLMHTPKGIDFRTQCQIGNNAFYGANYIQAYAKRKIKGVQAPTRTKICRKSL